MTELTITRRNLKKIAKLTIAQGKLTKEQKQRLTEVAATTPEILSGGWRRGACGCLIGTAYPEFFNKKTGNRKVRLAEDSEYDELFAAGIEFDDLLTNEIARRDLSGPISVRVID